MADAARERSEQPEPLPLSKAAENLLQECRVLLPGLQALFGFQLIAVFQPTFAQKFSPAEQHLHLLALGLGAVAGAIFMTPAAYHRQTTPREVTAGFITLSTRLLMAAMPLLALSVCIDFYLIARLLLGVETGALLATAVLAPFVGLWFVLPRVRLLRRALGDPCPARPHAVGEAGAAPPEPPRDTRRRARKAH